ncbi:hypothetical protein GIB67_019964 [Kingdonia uniflora]|uniref:non-specific serine/threonine protein kinase n=1 Tax=Kingdonia uniflora TaxID=39325 RepID=A0A7J7ML24_9MAGN|nr:hypothetical protein GIB67_019964 [Kingdonia uniflora]
MSGLGGEFPGWAVESPSTFPQNSPPEDSKVPFFDSPPPEISPPEPVLINKAPPPVISSSSPPLQVNLSPPPPAPPLSPLPSHSGSSPILPPPQMISPPPFSDISQPSPPTPYTSSPSSPPVIISFSPPPPISSVILPPPPNVVGKLTPPTPITIPLAPSFSFPPPLEKLPTPIVSNTPSPSGFTPPLPEVTPPLFEAPPSANPSPQLLLSPPTTMDPNLSPTIPSAEVSASPPFITTSPSPQTRSGDGSATPPSSSTQLSLGSTTMGQYNSSSISSKTSEEVTIVGVTVAGVVLLVFIAFFFIVIRRKKRRAQVFSATYGPAPTGLSVETDGYFYKRKHKHQHIIQPSSSPVANGRNYRGGTPESDVISGNKLSFSYEELMKVTSGFSKQNVIGEGGFGSVYKGSLADGRVVAVKELKAGSGQGEREFRAEVEIISRVHHRHLVSLVGYCIAEHHRLLVYEYVSNNNLDHHLHGKGMPSMDWVKRVKIAIGAARGLAYLHEDCTYASSFRTLLSNLSFFRFSFMKSKYLELFSTSLIISLAYRYMAPEYASSGKLTDRSDVFSFGVVLLELVTGRKPIDMTQPLGDESLVEWARPLLIRGLDTGDFSELADPRLEKRYVEIELFRMIEAAAACVRHSAPKRPRMVQVVRALDIGGDSLDLTNGMKFGQSTVYDSSHYSTDIENFRKMAFGNGDGFAYNTSSGEYCDSTEVKYTSHSLRTPPEFRSVELLSTESEAYDIRTESSELSADEPHIAYGSLRISQK